MTGRSVLVVDHCPDFRTMLKDYLSKQDLGVITAESGAVMRRILGERPVDMVLLDVKMPDEDGFSLTRYLREHYRTSIILLSAVCEVVDRIIGLEMGADDFITKPIDLRELLARIKSVLRRTTCTSEECVSSDHVRAGIRFGRCTLDLDSYQLFGQDGQQIHITSMEFDLLKAFATHPNQVLSRDQLLSMAHRRGWEPFDRSIDIRITRLRRKIEVDPAKPQTIKTVRGIGYTFVPDGKG